MWIFGPTFPVGPQKIKCVSFDTDCIWLCNSNCPYEVRKNMGYKRNTHVLATSIHILQLHIEKTSPSICIKLYYALGHSNFLLFPVLWPLENLSSLQEKRNETPPPEAPSDSKKIQIQCFFFFFFSFWEHKKPILLWAANRRKLFGLSLKVARLYKIISA